MKILYVVSGTGLQGGATKSFFAMADGVAREGNEIKVVAPDANGVTVAARERGWEVLVVPYRFCALPSWHTMRDKLMFLPRLLKTVICNLKARKVVRKFAEHYRPDIIHDNTSVTDIGHYAATHIGATHVIHVREYGWKDFRLVLPFINERLHYPKAALIAITDDLRELRGKGMPADRCTTIYNGVVKKEQIRYNPDKEPYFLYAGRIQEAKGVRDLIDAYINYARKIQSESKNPMRMVMAGSVTHDPGLYADLRRKLLDAGLDGNVEWMGEIKNVDKYMSRTAATVIPSLWEGFGRVMPEAMASGSLCVARDTGGTAEQLRNGRRMSGHDIALSFTDNAGLTARLLEVDEAFRGGEAYKAGGKYEKMIKDSQKVVENYYLCEEVGRKTLDFYNRLLKQDK